MFCVMLMTSGAWLRAAVGARRWRRRQRTTVPIMGAARINATATRRVVRWAGSRDHEASMRRACRPKSWLRHFIAEGAAEGVAGDVAFIQSISKPAGFDLAA